MRGTLSLLGKDLSEHGAALAGLLLATLALVGLALAQNRAAAYSMSPFEVVRFALLTVLPLVTLVAANRLVAREYLSRTRLFVEALPVGRLWPLALKWLAGFAWLALVVASTLALCTLVSNRVVDDPTPQWLALLLGKSLVVAALWWSIAFCFSLCGHLRTMLYAVLLALVWIAASWSAIDESRLPPFALLDAQLFVFERDVVPWDEMLGTLGIAAAFTLAGFAIAALGGGSVAERLARPASRRDHVALAALAIVGLGTAATIAERRTVEPAGFVGRTVLVHDAPAVELHYIDPAYEEQGRRFFGLVVGAVTGVAERLGLANLATVRIALRPSREAHDIDYGASGDVYVAANWTEHDAYDDAVLVAVVLHGLLSVQSGGRAPFEPHHWVLDGFTRWWAETGGDPEALDPDHRDELLARAAYALARFPQEDPDGTRADLLGNWQLIADRFAYPGAEALAFAAMHWLAVEGPAAGAREGAVAALASEFLATPVGSTALASARDRRRAPEARFAAATGLEWARFDRAWREWLVGETARPGVAAALGALPPLAPRFSAGSDERGVQLTAVGYERIRPGAEAEPGGATAGPDLGPVLAAIGTDEAAWRDGRCLLRHARLGPFAGEYDVDDEDEVGGECREGAIVHELLGRYAPGDRAYATAEFESDRVHQSVRLGSARLDVPAPELPAADAPDASDPDASDPAARP